MKTKQVLTSLIFIYQKTISPWLGPHCRFEPSCSEWSRQAIEAFGVRKGIWLALARLFRCHPLHPGGCEPLEVFSRG